jgi:asparagine synthase (glutamine-hydrolysing)
MCGICGFTGQSNSDVLARMRALISHRGPDETGSWESPRASLGIQRLRIIDLKTGQQPVGNEDETIHAVFNGEIYNFEALRSELITKGHRFKSRTDSEVIVHLYEEQGDAFVSRLRGMFAIAIWDTRSGRLTLARDRLGKKPLYYVQIANQIFFASEIKSLLTVPGVRRDVDRNALAHYLAYLYIPAPYTIFEQIRSLPPAHTATWQSSQLKLARYWAVPPPYKGEDRTVEDWTDLIDAKLNEAATLRLVSDVPLGVFLSGGLDSSLLVALLSKMGTVKTFSVGFDQAGQGYDELAQARRVASLFGTEHHESIVNCDVLQLLPNVVWHFDQPFGNSTAPLAYLLSGFARRHVTVALAGTAGDEVFSGYPRYLGLRVADAYQRVPAAVRRYLVAPLIDRLPQSTNGNTRGHRLVKRVERLVSATDLEGPARYGSWLTYFDSQDRDALVQRSFLANGDSVGPEAFLQQHWLASGDDLDKAWHLDLQTFLPYNQLEYLDKMSMAQSLEARAPYCDHELIELCAQIPASLRIRGLTGKYMLKRVAERYLPQGTVRRPKVGFDAPVGRWFKHELRPFAEAFFGGSYPFRLLNGTAVRELGALHFSGRRDLSTHLWMLLVLEVWYQMFIEQNVTSAPSATLTDVLGMKAAA